MMCVPSQQGLFAKRGNGWGMSTGRTQL